MEVATFICNKYNDATPLCVPKADELLRVVRDKSIIADYKSGLKINELAKKYDIRWNWILKLLKRSWDKSNVLPTPPEPEIMEPIYPAEKIQIEEAGISSPRQAGKKSRKATRLA